MGSRGASTRSTNAQTNAFHRNAASASASTPTASRRNRQRPAASASTVESRNSGVFAEQKMSLEQLSHLMNRVNSAVQSADFSTQLSNDIFLLCQQLKTHGQHLEETDKSLPSVRFLRFSAELNKIFVSLRQACCRDSGQLGTPCRLKMMELIELRAMGWRTNLAHSQYYLSRSDREKTESSKTSPSLPSSTPPSHHSSTSSPSKGSPFVPNAQPAFSVPTTAPNPQIPQFTTNHQFIPQPTPIFVPSELSAPQPSTAAPPGYFLIPAAGGWSPQMMPGMVAANGPFPSPIQMRQPPPDWMARNAAVAAVSAHFGKPNPMSQSFIASTQQPNSKSSKQPQFREEITIRNADSGKIMGVRGRRVAVVEELSKTIISFQKVDANSRTRSLAITGSTAESIQFAKRLIEETIRRNVSPNRLEVKEGEIQPENTAPAAEEEEAEEDEDEEMDGGISIETGVDGTLKLSCADPEMLQALAEYLSLRTNRMTAEERELKKERRKSMPLQTSTPAVVPKEPKSAEEGTKVQQPAHKSVQIHSNAVFSETRRSLVGSTPNLLAEALESRNNRNQIPKAQSIAPADSVRRYERNQMLKIRGVVDADPQLQTPLSAEIRDDLLKSVEEANGAAEST